MVPLRVLFLWGSLMLGWILCVLISHPANCIRPPPPDPIEIALQALSGEEAEWRQHLSRPLPTCHVRSVSKDDDDLPPGESGESLAGRVGIPPWVLQRLNPQANLIEENTELGAVFLVPAVYRWRTARFCVDPIRYISN